MTTISGDEFLKTNASGSVALQLEALGRRAVACAGWTIRVPDGCGRLGNEGVLWIPSDADLWNAGGHGQPVPDFSDPATRGVLLELVRRAWKRPDLFVIWDGEDGFWSVCVHDVESVVHEVPLGNPARGDTEKEALVLALEAAEEHGR